MRYETTIHTPPPVKFNYPCLLFHKNSRKIVWAISPGWGICVNRGDDKYEELGQYKGTWTFRNDPDDWELFNGEILLSND